MQFILEEVAPEVIKFPKTNAEKEAVAKEFEKVHTHVSIYYFLRNLVYKLCFVDFRVSKCFGVCRWKLYIRKNTKT